MPSHPIASRCASAWLAVRDEMRGSLAQRLLISRRGGDEMLGEPKLVELLALGNFSCSSLAMRAIPHIAARPRRRS